MGRTWGSLAALAAVALAGCGSAPPEGCTDVPADVTHAVREGIDGDFGIYDTAQAIQADSGVWYVAFEVRAADDKDEQAVWAVNALTEEDGVGPIMAVDGYAQSFTTWPALEGANGKPIVSDVKRCLDQ